MRNCLPCADQIQVWMLNASEHTELSPSLLEQLSPEEQARAQRFRNTSQGAQWAYFHACVRQILAAYTGQAPTELHFSAGAHQKPLLCDANPCVYFNLSHSGDLALLAVTGCAPIGVDLEQQRDLHDMDALVQRFFSPAEQTDYRQHPNSERSECFYRIWTRKEALIKANGSGLSAPLSAFDVPASPLRNWEQSTVRPPLANATLYPLLQLDPAPGYIGALALELPEHSQDLFPAVEVKTYRLESSGGII
jgi:4'-phosphopantetheinyl transferase